MLARYACGTGTFLNAAAAAAPGAAASLVQAFGEGLLSARVGALNKFGVYCGAAGNGELSFELCGPETCTATSMLSALPVDQVDVLPAAIDKKAGVVLVNYKVSSRGAPPCPALPCHYYRSTVLFSLTHSHRHARVGYYVLWIYFNHVPIPSAPFILRAVHDEDARLQQPVRHCHCELVNLRHVSSLTLTVLSPLAEGAPAQVAHRQRAQ